MENRTYTNRNDAIYREIIEPIEYSDANADDYDIDTIADVVLGGHEDGYALKVNTDTFWAVVEANEL